MSLHPDFQLVQETASVDEAGYINLGQQVKSREYRILTNASGQILLDPIENLPEQEQWLWRNLSALNAVHEGIEQARVGQLKDLGSFGTYADLELED